MAKLNELISLVIKENSTQTFNEKQVAANKMKSKTSGINQKRAQ